ncbi:MAG: transpeptidase family protein [Candidatus Marinimicrobia bacterium]|nr:transpeptidase family protein [Candidatus Neomarinimicrobiota bacterium]
MTKTYLKYRTRVMIISSLVIMSWAGLAIRLFQVQIMSGERYHARGIQQGQFREPVMAVRGNIFDRNNTSLTRNIIHYSIGAHPSGIRDKEAIAVKVSEVTGRDSEYYMKKLKSGKSFVYLERNLRKDVYNTLDLKKTDGIIVERNSRRNYPHDNVGAQIIGLVDVDDHGVTGLEKDYDKTLLGTPGWIVKQRNGKGQLNPKTGFPSKHPVDGANIQTTLDLEYQSILQDELANAVKSFDATSATGVIIDPQTGNILAISSVPDFDPNNSSQYPTENQKIRAITDQFEPGSTYKIVAATAALDLNTVTADQEFNCEYGGYTLKDVRINDHEEYGLLTVVQIIQHSSNVGIIKIAETIGKNSFYRYCRDFGFGSNTNINLTGEVNGTLRKVDDWSDISLAELSMGHEIGVTALQLAVAYSAIANGGYLLRPRLVHQIVDQNGQIVYRETPEVIRKIASPQVMESVKSMLVKVVESGTGGNAQIMGWSVAGKTGTAQKFIDGKYSNSKFVSNFVGFFPAENPQVLGVIIIDEPRYGKHWGGEGAAPVFRRVMQRIINMDDNLETPKTQPSKSEPVLAQTKMVMAMNPISSISTALLQTTEFYSEKEKLGKVPEVRGMSLKKALSTLRKAHLKVKVNGSGKVIWQSPAPGTRVKSGNTCEIGLQ